MTSRKRARRPTRSRIVASLVEAFEAQVDELGRPADVDGVAELAGLMGVDRRSVERWLSGHVIPQGMVRAFHGLLVRLDQQAYFELSDLAQGRFVMRVQHYDGYVDRVPLEDLVGAWLVAKDGPLPALPAGSTGAVER
jgi:hypothetical protein